MKATLEEGWDRSARTHPPLKTESKEKNPKEKTDWVDVPSPPHSEPWNKVSFLKPDPSF